MLSFDVIASDPEAFRKQLEARDLNGRVLEFGQEIIL
jgi:hypothetical protein